MQMGWHLGKFCCLRDTFKECSEFFSFYKHNIFYVYQTETSQWKKKETSLYLVKYIGLENMQKGVQRNFKRVLV